MDKLHFFSLLYYFKHYHFSKMNIDFYLRDMGNYFNLVQSKTLGLPEPTSRDEPLVLSTHQFLQEYFEYS